MLIPCDDAICDLTCVSVAMAFLLLSGYYKMLMPD